VTGDVDANGANASFNAPGAIAIDSNQNLFVADVGNFTIRKITAAGQVTTFVGQAGMQTFTPGDAPGVIDSPLGLTLSGSSLYFTDNNGVISVSNVP